VQILDTRREALSLDHTEVTWLTCGNRNTIPLGNGVSNDKKWVVRIDPGCEFPAFSSGITLIRQPCSSSDVYLSASCERTHDLSSQTVYRASPTSAL
jgi:hypothetical protein